MSENERRGDQEAAEWAKAIKERDNRVCQLCGRYGISLHSHHLNCWSSFPTQRYELENGICLCEDCHNGFHNVYGRGKNTKYQFEQYKQSYNIIKLSLQKLYK
jgi:5-methylcytosine-specific restriction endonuclease McrA